MKQTIGIINSMTPAERRNPKLIDPSRRQRIASGAGVQPQEVNQLVKQFDMMAPIMKRMAGKGMGGRMQAIRELQRERHARPGRQRTAADEERDGQATVAQGKGQAEETA